MIEDAVWEFGAVDAPSYFGAQTLAESAGNPRMVSTSGAIGLMQVKPSTLNFVRRHFPNHYFGKNLRDPNTNIRVAVAYHYYIRYRHERGIPYGDAMEASMGYTHGHNGGAEYVNEAYSSRYAQKIEYYQRLLPALMCRR